ncbi:ATP synthase subunit epsilon [Candidatus Hepatincolaceae symbiont of Richtersius coronifer]
MTKLNFSILSGSAILAKEQVDMVVIPGLKGDIGIIAGIRDFVYLLKPGIIYLFTDGKVSARYFILMGRFEANEDKLVVDTELEIYNLDKVDIGEINNKITSYEQALTQATDDYKKEYYKKQSLLYKQLIESISIRTY